KQRDDVRRQDLLAGLPNGGGRRAEVDEHVVRGERARVHEAVEGDGEAVELADARGRGEGRVEEDLLPIEEPRRAEVLVGRCSPDRAHGALDDSWADRQG